MGVFDFLGAVKDKAGELIHDAPDAAVGLAKGLAEPVAHTIAFLDPTIHGTTDQIDHQFDTIKQQATKVGDYATVKKITAEQDSMSQQLYGFKKSADTGTKIRSVAGNAIQTGLDVATPGIAGGVEKGVADLFGFLAPKVAKAVAAPITGAVVGAPFGAAATLSDTSRTVTPGDVVEGAKSGAVTGAALGAGAELLHATVPPLIDSVRKAQASPAAEVGSIGPGTRTVLTPDDLSKLSKADNVAQVKSILKDRFPQPIIDEVAHPITLTHDTNVIQNIVDKASSPPPPPRVAIPATPTPVSDVPTAGQGSASVPKLPTLPKGYTYDEFGSIHDATGKELTIGQQQTLVQNARGEKYVSDFEQARSSGDKVTMNRIAGEHPTDQRLQLPGVTPTAPGDATQQVMDAISGTRGNPGVRALQVKQKALLSAERGQRFAAAEGAGANLEGTEGFKAELSKLGGKYTKVEWNGLQDQLGGAKQAESTYSQLRAQMKQLPDLTYTDKLNTDVALRKLILGEGLPTASDIKRLETAFGSDFAHSVEQHLSTFQKGIALTKQLIGVPRAIMSSGDVSFGGRQALAYATAHPIEFAKQWTQQFKYFKEGLKAPDSEALSRSFNEIKAHPDYQLAKDSGLALTDVLSHDPETREEQYIAGNLAEKIPLLGRLVRGSDYAFTGLANNIRANSFYSLVDQARSAGYDVNSSFAKDIAKVVNNGTGRGTIKALEQHMGTLSTALFSPRLMISRLQTFNPAYYVTLNPIARREALRQLFGLATFATSALGIAKVAGLQVGTNPLSSDFGKIKVGDTRLDFFGGYAQYIKLFAQLAAGQTVSSLTGHSTALGAGYGSKSRKDIIYNFLENKENPVLSFISTLIQGKDAVGNDIYTPGGITSQVLQRFTPLVSQDIADMTTHNGINPVVGGALALGGIGTQTYGTSDIKLSGTQQKYVDKLSAANAPPDQIKATTDFYQIAKTGPDRTQAATDIKAAIASGDLNKALKLAQDYNTAYAQNFSDWVKQYGKYKNDPTLLKAYASNRITSDSLDRWAVSVQNSK